VLIMCFFLAGESLSVCFWLGGGAGFGLFLLSVEAGVQFVFVGRGSGGRFVS